jgi:hypothetical protein
MKALSTVLREQNITKRAEILEFVRNAELFKKKGGAKIDSEKVRYKWHDSNACFLFNSLSIYASDIHVGIHHKSNSLESLYGRINKLDDKIKELEAEKQVIKDKINFLKESRSDELVENEYRAYQAILTINKESLTDFEKAKIISDLM